jgi:transcriptional regulator NrdR family protein
MAQCPICNGYDHNHFLTTHKLSPLGDTTVRKYHCTTCDHLFETEEKLVEVEVTPDDMKRAFNHILKQLKETKEELNKLKSTFWMV